MKNPKFLTVFSAAILFSIALVVVVSCQKTNDVKQAAGSGLDDESTAVTQHILDFKAKMEYYKNNPGLKSSEKEYVLDAILDWESTLNFDYCYSYVDVSEIKIYDTIIAIPVDGEDSMAMADVSDKYYNDILVAVQTHYYVYVPFPNQKLMVVDLEPSTNYDSVVVSTWIGNDTPGMLHPEYDWKYGMYGGTCDGQHFVGISDAAQQAAIYTRNAFYEAPPAGKRWTFPNPITITAKPLDEENGVLIYLNPDDDDGVNNNMDYLIYYASASVPPGLSTTVRCVEASPELNFYKQSYVDLTQGWMTGDRKFKECTYEGKNYTTTLQHELITEIGNRFVTDVAVIDLPPID